MKKFHQDKYGKIVPCGKRKRPCLLTVHLSEAEFQQITDYAYDNGKLNKTQTSLYLDHINADYYKRKEQVATKRQFGITRYDFMRIGRTPARKYDPFGLNVRYGPVGFMDELEKELNLPKVNDFVWGEETYATYRAARRGDYKPLYSDSLELVKAFFENKKKFVVPRGTSIRTTNPKLVFGLTARKQLKPKVLHVNTGSVEVTTISKFKPVSVTWLGSDGWLYNVEVSQAVLDAN